MGMSMRALVLICAGLFGSARLSSATPLPLADFHHIYINVSNDNGARLGSDPDDSYFIRADGGGLNQLHITTDSTPAGVAGQVTRDTIPTSSTAGTFWISTTGGRG